MSHSQETLSSKQSEANALIATFDEKMNAAQDLYEQEFLTFEQAYNRLNHAKELLPVDEAADVKRAMATVISRLRAKQAREMDVKRLEELNEGLNALEDAYNRTGLEDSRSYENVARNYLSRIEGEQSTAETSVDKDVDIARNEFLIAIDQMNNDAKAYMYLDHYFDSNDK
ncbi:MAG: hypothetical protein QG549_247 [Patescibacteria group bacterium]|nr:hypothetical protein [Patescibacteria group bacterium]